MSMINKTSVHDEYDFLEVEKEALARYYIIIKLTFWSMALTICIINFVFRKRIFMKLTLE